MREKKQKFKKLIIFKDERALSHLVPHQNIIYAGQAFGRLILKSSAFFLSSLFKRKEKLKIFRKLAPSSLSPPTVSTLTLVHSGYYDISILSVWGIFSWPRTYQKGETGVSREHQGPSPLCFSSAVLGFTTMSGFIYLYYSSFGN